MEEKSKIIKPKVKKPPKIELEGKKERYQKFAKLKDLLHHNLGSPFVTVGVCLKECKNKGKVCKNCFRFDHYKPLK